MLSVSLLLKLDNSLFYYKCPESPVAPYGTCKGFIFSVLEPIGVGGTEPSSAQPSPAAVALACVCLSGYVYTDEEYKFPLLLAFCILFVAPPPPLPPLQKRKQLLLHSVVRLFFLTKMR